MADNDAAHPNSSELHSLAYQVGGHAGIQVIGDGALIVKAALPVELQFYQSIQADSALASLRQWVPTYIGTLRLEGQNTAEGLASVDGVPDHEKEMIVIENVAHGFRKPNILDIKLGTVLYDEDATPEKRERMEKQARETTSAETGIRLTGFQLFGNESSEPLVVPKDYGKSLRATELHAGIARFFPVHDSMIGLPGADPGGRMDVGLPETLLVPILRIIRKSVQEIRDILSRIELRMVGCSLLIVYEGDWSRAERSVEWLGKEEECVSSGEDEDEDEDEEDSEEDGGTDWPCAVRLIDFAHTRVVGGEGPDRGVLRGVDTVLGLLDGRIRSLM
ncbi:hypothetical protein F5148DRAFT_165858 [Russula earlei]|uniref:Uncharacterized protein n=1 Tax=Russula earlei TaxID=71964 RepID=A0ACC0U669_9AGAM|nr:hypothetical protein F5148DRAFT_165858 [Russula earlei]